MNRNTVVLTGAGISAESGLRTFSASDGLWEECHIEDIATPEGFVRGPNLVHQFYNDRRRKLTEVKPNAAHTALAEFEARCKGNFLLVTQNIDDLHERAGSRQLVHMHGELLKMFCLHCDSHFEITDDLNVTSICLNCQRSSGLRPDIVWFGEMPYHMARIESALAECALFVSIGTSGNVYPAAGFVQLARRAGAECVELNLERSAGSDYFDHAHYGSATIVVPEFFA
ncbi:NAD-dependent deacylase [Candidatus Persebacteraceae bacterium Df01]|jgi:NAD-dependent deacetylase|uniref:NAD-dependent protein deacylase n=1 Tax=Candidatus Doriopsillibacter californiensis TaxID=2970740 RepID=A0ABT7QNE1_9GAMM|nr:NAD-dependent deacylase [Candidatus Persebacteraceae bacterium Df01]